MPGAIFVSYRRTTTSNAAGRLADRLMDHFGQDQVFVDVEAIEPGVDFVEVMEKAVAACRVLLVVIGPTWHTVADAAGRRRLDDPNDPVVVEVRAGLANPGARVIPVLVEGAQMPRVVDLPVGISQLARLNAARLEHMSFRQDVARLVEVVERAISTPQGTSMFLSERHEGSLLLPDQYPAPTTCTDLVEARSLGEVASDHRGRWRATVAYRRAMGGGHPDAPLAAAELGIFLLDSARGYGEPPELGDALNLAVASGHAVARAVAVYGLATLAGSRGDRAEYRRLLLEAAESRYRPVAARANNKLAFDLAFYKEYDRARLVYERAVSLGSEERASWVPLAVYSLADAGRTAEASALLQWVVRQPTTDEKLATSARMNFSAAGETT